MIDTKKDANLEIVAITEGYDLKESQTMKGLPLMSDLNPYILSSSDTPVAFLIHIKLKKNNYDQMINYIPWILDVQIEKWLY